MVYFSKSGQMFNKFQKSSWLNYFKNSSFGKLIDTYRSKLIINKLTKELSTIDVQPFSVFILGMHRSGTSCLTGMLNKYGLYLGAVLQGGRHNKKGPQESRTVMKINNELLSVNGGSWFKPKKVENIPLNLAVKIEKYYLQMTRDAYLLDKMCWGCKDPRMLFCLPAWLKKDKVVFVGTIRHPNKVMSSLLARDKRYNEQKGDPWELWFQYNSELLSLYRIKRFPIINFDWKSSRYSVAVKNIALYLGLESDCENFFDENLIHQKSDEYIKNSKYRNLYLDLVEIAEIEERFLSQKYK